MLHSLIGRDEAGRRAAINTIGPLWDGNEVWLIVAGAGMFAAFPGWYATMFSAYNLALVLLLAALIVRGVAFEYRGKRDAARWRRTWDAALTTGSVLAPLLIGVALAGLLHGLPDQLSPGLHRVVLGPAPALRPVDRGHPGAGLRAARRDIPVPEDHRRHARAVLAGGPPRRPFHRRRRDRLHHLDPRHRQHHVLPQRDRTARHPRRRSPPSGSSGTTARASPSPRPPSPSRPASSRSSSICTRT